MCQLPRAFGVPLLTAIALTAPLSVSATDAGSEPDGGVPEPDGAANAGGDAGTAPELEWLFPPPGATDVVINPSFLLRAERAVVEPVPTGVPKPTSFGEGLLLRDPLGNLVSVGSLLALQPPRYGSLEPRVELSSAPLELKANTRYEVLSRIAICEGSPTRSVCLEAGYHTLGAFETGIVFDHKPASISSIQATDISSLACVWTFSVVGADDLAPPSALRFLVDDQAWLGPSLSLVGHSDLTIRASRPVQVVPVDPSGNRGAPMTVDLGGCKPPLALGENGDGSTSAPPASASPPAQQQPPRQQLAGGPKDSCSLTPRASRTGSSFSVLALASLWRYRRRQRRS